MHALCRQTQHAKHGGYVPADAFLIVDDEGVGPAGRGQFFSRLSQCALGAVWTRLCSKVRVLGFEHRETGLLQISPSPHLWTYALPRKGRFNDDPTMQFAYAPFWRTLRQRTKVTGRISDRRPKVSCPCSGRQDDSLAGGLLVE